MSTATATTTKPRRRRQPTKAELAAVAETMFQFPETERADRQRLEKWVTRLCAARERFLVGGVIAFGRALIEAKAELVPHGQWMDALKQLGIGQREAENHVKIAKHAVLSNSENFPNLPHAVSTLCVLADLPNEKVEELIATGVVHPSVTRAALEEALHKECAEDYDHNGWRTPQHLFEMLNEKYGPFTIDLAASAENALCDRYYTKEDDALAQCWGGEVGFCNPPYDDIEPWIEKAMEASVHDHAFTVFVLPVRSDRSWWRHYVARFATEVDFLERLSFVSPDGYAGRDGNGSECHAVVVFGHVIVPEFVRGADGETIPFEEALDDDGLLTEVIAGWRASANESLLFARSAEAMLRAHKMAR